MNSLNEEIVESPKIPKNNQKIIVVLSLIFFLILITGITLFSANKKIVPPKPSSSQVILEDYNVAKPTVVSQRIEQLSAFSPEEKMILTKAFAERDWPNADTERKRWGAYSNLYGSLWARYNVTQDQAIKAEMGKIEEFMKNTWSSFYPAAVRGGNFLR